MMMAINSSSGDEESGGGNQGRVAEHSTGKKTDDGHFCTAGDETGGHNGDLTVTLLFDGTGG